MENIKRRVGKFEKKDIYILCIMFLYIMSLTLSKFGISFFGGILALVSIFYFLKNKGNKYFQIFFLLYILGITLQLFSLGGLKSSIFFSYKNYFLLISPLIILYLNKENIIEYFINIVELGIFIGILKSFYNFYIVYKFNYTAYIRVDSFFDIMRWGIVLVMSLLLILPNLYKKKIFSWVVFLSGIASLILNNSRGPFLSLILGMVVFFILGKKIKILSVVLTIAFLFYYSGQLKVNNLVEHFHKRISSVLIIERGGNAARIFMWKENVNFMLNSLKGEEKKLFFLGTGIKNRKKAFKDYIEKKENYTNLEEDIKRGVSFDDAHNTYLNMFIQTGAIYSFVYYLSLLYLSFKVLFKYIETKRMYILSSFAAMCAFYFCGIFYGYSFTYETFLFFFVISLGLSGKE